jgi:hypothetical protein
MKSLTVLADSSSLFIKNTDDMILPAIVLDDLLRCRKKRELPDETSKLSIRIGIAVNGNEKELFRLFKKADTAYIKQNQIRKQILGVYADMAELPGVEIAEAQPRVLFAFIPKGKPTFRWGFLSQDD